MDHSYPYIASLTREPFLFYEMRLTAKLMAEENSDEAIVKKIVVQNLFQYPTEKSIARMAKACIKRLHALEDDFCDCITADRGCKTDLPLCTYEAESPGLGIYDNGHWREIPVKGHVFWKNRLEYIFYALAGTE